MFPGIKIIRCPKRCSFNSVYGSLGNEWCRWYDIKIAEAITHSGQLAILWIQKHLNKYMNEISGTVDVDYIVAADTDSVVGDTLVYVDGRQLRIDELYNRVCNDDNFVFGRDENDFIHDVSGLGLTTKSVKDDKVVEDRIVHIMKHRVKKRLFRVNVNGSSVIMTEDHSLIVSRLNNLVSVKPYEVEDGDVIISLEEDGLEKTVSYKNSSLE